MTAYFTAVAPREAHGIRVHARDPAELARCVGAWKDLATGDRDESDTARERVLGTIVQRPRITGTVHEGVSPSDVLHVYLDGAPAGRVFACVVVSEARLEQMLTEAPLVVEGLSLQVASTRWLTPDSVRAAMEAWASRNFGRVPVFELRPWIDTESAEVLDAPAHPAVTFELEVEHRPIATLAEPPYEEAA